MVDEQSSARVVVGVDGSDASLEALRWAAREAQLIGATLQVVTAWQYPAGFGWTTAADRAELEGGARSMLEAVVRPVRVEHPDVAITLSVREGHPAAVLIEAGDGADRLVVGSRGRGAFASMLLGSVGLHCAHHAPCPLVIVRDRGQPPAPPVAHGDRPS